MKAKELKTTGGEKLCLYCQTEISHPVTFTGVHRKETLIAVIGSLITAISFWFLTSDPNVVIKGSGMAVLAAMGLIFGGSFGGGLSLVVMYRWLSRNIIGRTYFHFTDEDGLEHTHKDNPTLPTSPWFAWWKEHTATIPVFQMRYGGWFRKSKIIGWPAKWWSIEQSWDGFVNALFVGLGGHGVFVGDGPKDIVESLVQKWPNLAGVVGYAEKLKQAEQQLAEANTQLEGLRKDGHYLRVNEDKLGTIIMRVLEKISRMRSTVGRSQHAREIRAFLEQELKALERDDARMKLCIREWSDRANSAEDAEVREAASAKAAR